MFVSRARAKELIKQGWILDRTEVHKGWLWGIIVYGRERRAYKIEKAF